MKFAIGPAIDTGFYYDIDSEHVFTPEDLTAIEKEMAKIVKQNLPLVRSEVPRKDALTRFAAENEIYKVELINDLPEDAVISLYTQGDFTDLCAGPHCPSTGRVKAFKLMSLAGAYWRGNEKNKMLQRIYGTAFPSKEELDEYLHMLEEAEKRDHRKLGKELDIFSMHDEGPGFPFFHPNGMRIRNAILEYWHQVHRKYHYEQVMTPMIMNRDLWIRSGHWDHYRENMYFTKIDDPLLQGTAAPLRGTGPGTPSRTVRRAARVIPCPLLHPGRCPYLHDPGTDPAGNHQRNQTVQRSVLHFRSEIPCRTVYPSGELHG